MLVNLAIEQIATEQCHYTCSALRVAARKLDLTFEQSAEICNRYYAATNANSPLPIWWNSEKKFKLQRITNLSNHKAELNRMAEEYLRVNKLRKGLEVEDIAKELKVGESREFEVEVTRTSVIVYNLRANSREEAEARCLKLAEEDYGDGATYTVEKPAEGWT